MSASEASSAAVGGRAAAASTLAAADPWQRLLDATGTADFLQAWLEVLAGRLPAARRLALLARDDDGVYRAAAAWPAGVDLTSISAVAARTLDTRALQAAPLGDGPAHEAIGFPLESGGELLGAIVIVVATGVAGAERVRLLRELHWSSAWLVLSLRPTAADASAASAGPAAAVLKALESLHPHRLAFDAALALANHLSQATAAPRVAVGLVRRDRIEVTAISATPWFDRRTREVVAIGDAMDEAAEQRRSTVWPPPAAGAPGQARAGDNDDGEDERLRGAADRQGVHDHRATDAAAAAAVGTSAVPPHAATALTTSLAASLAPGRCGLVVVLPGDDAYGIGAVWFERAAALPWSPAELRQLEQVARWCGPALQRIHDGDRWWAGRAAVIAQAAAARLRDPRRPGLKVALGAAALVLLALLLLPVERRVTANAAIEGGQERVVAAPFDGFIAAARLKAGDRAGAGAVLAELDTRDLRLELAQREADRDRQRRRQIDAMSKRDLPAAGVASAAVAEAEAQIELISDRLARARLTADADTVLVAGDLTQQVGAPVRQGQVLFRLAPTDRWRAILRVDERDVREVAPGQTGELLLSGVTSQPLRFEVVHIGAAEAANGINAFRVEARVLGDMPAVRPGMEGVGKITTGRAPLAWAWTRRVWQWAQLTAFRWLP